MCMREDGDNEFNLTPKRGGSMSRHSDSARGSKSYEEVAHAVT